MKHKPLGEIVICPKCRGIFTRRYRHGCPFCKTKLHYPHEVFSQISEGYFWFDGKWRKCSDIPEIFKEVTNEEGH